MPAGSRLKYRSNIPKYAEFVFEGVDAAFSKKALENKKAGVHNIIIAGASYGQGSSREHAAICPMYLGVKAVIAKSFERIHAANLINFGILPLTFANEADYDSIGASDKVEIGDIKAALSSGRGFEAQEHYERKVRYAQVFTEHEAAGYSSGGRDA